MQAKMWGRGKTEFCVALFLYRSASWYKKFFDRMISRGEEIILSTPLPQPGIILHLKRNQLSLSHGHYVSDEKSHMLPGN